MEENRDILEELQNYPNQFELKDELTEKAKALAKRKYDKEPRIRRAHGRAIFASVVSFVVLLCIAIPVSVYFSIISPIHDTPLYFWGNELQIEIVENLDETIEENNLTLHYYDDGYISVTNSVYFVIETGEFAYLKQRALFLREATFDTVELSVGLSNKRFEDFDDYYTLSEKTSILGKTVWYTMHQEEAYNRIIARFDDNSYTYYMSLQVTGTLDILSEYIDLLIN